jgi:DNA-binding CsgD family transcriptional regulator
MERRVAPSRRSRENRAVGAKTPATTPVALDGRGNGQVSAPSIAQLRVLELVALGLSSREIGSRLWVSRQTVTYHIGNLLVKLDAPTRAGLVARAYALGLLESGYWPPRVSVSAMRGFSRPDVA